MYIINASALYSITITFYKDGTLKLLQNKLSSVKPNSGNHTSVILLEAWNPNICVETNSQPSCKLVQLVHNIKPCTGCCMVVHYAKTKI